MKLCFPQYREGALPEDGFANKLNWEVIAAVRGGGGGEQEGGGYCQRV